MLRPRLRIFVDTILERMVNYMWTNSQLIVTHVLVVMILAKLRGVWHAPPNYETNGAC